MKKLTRSLYLSLIFVTTVTVGAAVQASESISYMKKVNDYGTETKSLLKDGIGGIFTSARHPDILLFTSSEGRKSHLFFESGSYSTMYLDILKFERKSAVTGEITMGELTDMASSVWVLTPENQEVYDDYMSFLQEPETYEWYDGETGKKKDKGEKRGKDKKGKRNKDRKNNQSFDVGGAGLPLGYPFGDSIFVSQASADACAFEFDEVQNHGFEGTATLDDCNRAEGIALVGAEISVLLACSSTGPSLLCAGAIVTAESLQAAFERKTTQCIFSFKQSVNAFDKCIAENTPPEDDSADDGSGNTGGGSGGGGGGPGGGSGNTGGDESSGPVRRGSFGDGERCFRDLPDGNGGTTEVTVDCP